jgi:SAM-dependent methyltransferase
MAGDIYTHGHHDAVLRSHRWRTAANSAAYLLPHLTPGQRLLDVGCGPGTLTVDLARLVEPGEVLGVDLDATVVAEAPRLAPHVEAMRERIAAALGIDITCVSVKPKTSDGLGFTGRGEGIAAFATLLLE